MRRHIFMAPQAAGGQIDDLHMPLNAWQLEAQLKIGIDQQRQLTDQHQPLIRDATEEPDRLVREPIKNFQEIRQLMTLDTAISKHAKYHFERPLSMAALVL